MFCLRDSVREQSIARAGRGGTGGMPHSIGMQDAGSAVKDLRSTTSSQRQHRDDPVMNIRISTQMERNLHQCHLQDELQRELRFCCSSGTSCPALSMIIE